MTTDTRVRARLAQHAAQGRWTLFVAGGAGRFFDAHLCSK